MLKLINKVYNPKKYGLIYATRYNQYDIVEKFINNNEDLNIVDDEGWTPLMMACRYQYHLIVKQLIDNGADIHLKNEMGKTALHMASQWGELKSVKYLIENGTDINIQDCDGWTPLMYASRYSYSTSNFEIVKFLVESGAKLDLQNKLGWTALMLASRYSIVKTARFLLKSSANHQIKNNKGDKLIDIVIKKRYELVTKDILTETYDFEQIKKFYDNECFICLEKIDTKKIFLPCGHAYHAKCITKWFKKSTVCPLRC